jgi:hypothetical protein
MIEVAGVKARYWSIRQHPIQKAMAILGEKEDEDVGA